MQMQKIVGILLTFLLIGCQSVEDEPCIKKEIHGMNIGNDSLLLGGKIFYIDSIEGYCLVALVSQETQFTRNCEYPTWCPYYRSGGVEKFRYITGLSDTIGGGERNTAILVSEYGSCSNNPNYNHNNGFYGAYCAYIFVPDDTLIPRFDDYWMGNVREVYMYANIGGDPNWYSTSSQKDTNNNYMVNCRDKKIRVEPKSQKRLPLLVRRHNF